MASSALTAIEAARSQRSLFVRQFGEALESKGYGVPRMMAGGFPNYLELAYGQTLMRHAEQYVHFNGWTYCIISVIARRLAGQKVKMGRKLDTSPSLSSWQWDRMPGRRMSVVDKMRAPDFVKNLDTDVEIIESHPLLTAIANPNSVMTSWSLIYITVASMELTGKAYWWFIENDAGDLEIWPVPSDWVTPIHSDNGLFERYRIRPRGQFGVSEVIDGDEMAMFFFPDPSNPVGAISPAQTQAPAIAIDEEIQSSQYRFFKNGVFPGVKITTGRLPNMSGMGEGMRPILTADQRREIREAARALWQGSVNYNEPFIVDGLIEDVQRISQTSEEMGFIDSATFNKSRLCQTFGVNPYILGEVTGVNKAQAVVAESNFNVNVLSPIAALIGQVMSKHIGEPDVYFWLELPETSDPDQKLRNWTACLPYGVVKKGEYRQQILGIPPAGDETDEEYIQSGGGGGMPGMGGFPLPSGKPEPKADEGGLQGTPATEAEATSGDQERTRVATEAGDVPPSTPPREDDALPMVGTSHRPRRKGGPGSGNFGHEGRPGEVGGSASSEGGGGQSDSKGEWKMSERDVRVSSKAGITSQAEFDRVQSSIKPASRSDLKKETINLWHGTTAENARSILKSGEIRGGERGGLRGGGLASASAVSASQYPEDTGSDILIRVAAKSSSLGVDPNDQIGETVEDGLFRSKTGSSAELGEHSILHAFDLRNARKPDAAIAALERGNLLSALRLGVRMFSSSDVDAKSDFPPCLKGRADVYPKAAAYARGRR